MSATLRGPMAVGERYGTLVVKDLVTGAEAGNRSDGTWCWVRCDCGARRLVRARHLRGVSGRIRTCGSRGCRSAHIRSLKARA